MITPQSFCHQCGKKNMPGSKFCSSCGTNLTSLASNKPKIEENPHKVSTVMSLDNEDDDYIDHIEHLDIKMSEFDVEIKQHPTNQSNSLASLMGSPLSPKEVDELKRPVPKTLSRKKVLEQFKKEAGQSAKNS